MCWRNPIIVILISLGCICCADAQEKAYTHEVDVIYGRKCGMALTMDAFKPTTGGNRAAIIVVASGGWISTHDAISPGFIEGRVKPWLGRGYAVFVVIHGSQPRFTIPDAVADINRAVRFIRYHAKKYGIDENRIGMSGRSAGGHLSLMQAVHPAPPDPKHRDPVERVSSQANAVACLFPPTDFLNYGQPDVLAWKSQPLAKLRAPFAFQEIDNEGSLKPVSDERRREIGKEISPIEWVTKDSAPTLIIHGDADDMVPLEQSQRFIDKLLQAGVSAKLEVRPGMPHGGPNHEVDTNAMLDWFDRHLLP